MSTYKQQIVWGKNHPSNLLHIAAGIIIGVLVHLFFRAIGKAEFMELKIEQLAVIIVTIVGFLWEFLNMKFRKKVFDFKDFAVTVLGGVIYFIFTLF